MLSRRSARLDEGLFVVEGAVLIAEAIRGGWDVLAQFVTSNAAPVDGVDAPACAAFEGYSDISCAVEVARQ